MCVCVCVRVCACVCVCVCVCARARQHTRLRRVRLDEQTHLTISNLRVVPAERREHALESHDHLSVLSLKHVVGRERSIEVEVNLSRVGRVLASLVPERVVDIGCCC